MSARPRIAVLMGGPDAEREVSLCSGRAVAQALRAADAFDVVDHVVDTPTVDELIALGVDAVFPVLHGHWGEGGPLQERLEAAGMRYVGSRPRAARLAMDKLATKLLVAPRGVRTPRARQVMPDDPCDLAPPLVLKPVDDGSSVDLRICHDADAVRAARAELHPKRGRLLAEAYIRGREMTVGVLLGEPLPLIEIVPAATFYDYDAKYLRDDTQYRVAPGLPAAAVEEMTSATMIAFHQLGCRDLARADFILGDDGMPYFLEINTMPGFTDHSLLPQAAAHTGLSMPELCTRLVQAALARTPLACPSDTSAVEI